MKVNKNDFINVDLDYYNLHPLTLMTVKDVMNFCGCSRFVALRLRKEISRVYGIKTKFITLYVLDKFLRNGL